MNIGVYMMLIFWSMVLVTLSVIGAGHSINNPVYKINLRQKGFAQFLQYDIDVPPLREFSFCTWFRVKEFESDQSIFTYVVQGNNRVIRLWLGAGGRHLNLSIHRAHASVPVDLRRDWVHVCLSYQGDFGVWALYVDAHIVACEAVQSLYGYVIPGGGSIIIGYGTGDEGQQNGLEGEIFGVNMILASSIERNFTLKADPRYRQKSFTKNKVKYSNNVQYIVLKDLHLAQQAHLTDAPESKRFPSFMNINKSPEPAEVDAKSRKVKQTPNFQENEFSDYLARTRQAHIKDKTIFWKNINEANKDGKIKLNKKRIPEEPSDLMISDPTTAFATSSVKAKRPEPDLSEKKLAVERPPPVGPVFNKEGMTSSRHSPNSHTHELPDFETPPPPHTDANVYGQWTNSKFARHVLSYLKQINYRNNQRRIPPTIQLSRTTDEYPYASELKVNVVKPPMQLKRKNLIIEKRIHSQSMNVNPSIRIHVQKKREANLPQINLKILDNDIRSDILKAHARARAKYVTVTPRGAPKRTAQPERHADLSMEETTITRGKTFNTASDILNHKLWNNFGLSLGSNLLSSLPFLKSVEYFTGESDASKRDAKINYNNMYSKSFSKNKWHHIASKEQIDQHVPDVDSKSDHSTENPSGKKRVRHRVNIPLITYQDNQLQTNNVNIKRGRALALTVSNESNNQNNISILKYNHGYLPSNSKENTNKSAHTNQSEESNFHKAVKIGNALNEKYFIGMNEQQKKQSFEGGNERVPDIQRYRSELEAGASDAGAGAGSDGDTAVPGSLSPRVCSTADTYHHHNIFYIQPDESVDITYIDSPIKPKNRGIEFILQNYKSCSLEDSTFGKSNLVLLNWSTTPVRLFGGAMPKKTTDLCGFF